MGLLRGTSYKPVVLFLIPDNINFPLCKIFILCLANIAISPSLQIADSNSSDFLILENL